MDTMYKNKAKAEKQNSTVKAKHISDNYKSKNAPRAERISAGTADVNISKNLRKLNKNYVSSPAANKGVALSKVGKTEDSGARIVTEKAKARRPLPIAFISGIIIVTVVIMYTLSLNVKINEYNTSIAELESRIAELQESSERLDTQLESKYDLAEIQRIATEEYGMVSSDTLPKKYLSVASNSSDVAEKVESDSGNKSGMEKLISGFAAVLRNILE